MDSTSRNRTSAMQTYPYCYNITESALPGTLNLTLVQSLVPFEYE